jgi:hypothetical protein
MITLFNFGPAFRLTDPSPFVMKTEILLKMANLPYRTDNSRFPRAPKGKLPYIDDGGEIVADSTFIGWHLEKKYGIDFDVGCPQSNARSSGPLKRWQMTISTGRCWMRAGSIRPTLPRGQSLSSFEASARQRTGPTQVEKSSAQQRHGSPFPSGNCEARQRAQLMQSRTTWQQALLSGGGTGGASTRQFSLLSPALCAFISKVRLSQPQSATTTFAATSDA